MFGLKVGLLTLYMISGALPVLSGQAGVEHHDSGLTFVIREATLQPEGSRSVFRAVFDNRTNKDWCMRSAVMTLSLACKKGPRTVNLGVHLSDRDLAHSLLAATADEYAGSSTVQPGENAIAEPVHADGTCRLESLGPVRFRDLKPIDDITQRALDAERDSQRALERFSSVSHELDEVFQASCHRLYVATSGKKVSDLTVKEAQDVRDCRKSGLYH